MRRIRFAEWILSQVAGRDRAASITGDALEDPTFPGIARTIASLLWHGFASTFLRPILVAVAALLLEYVAGLAIPLILFGSVQYPGFRWVLGAVSVINLAAGAFLARMCPGREVATWIVWILLSASMIRVRSDPRAPVPLSLIVVLSSVVFVPSIVGVLLGRRRRKRLA